MSSSADPSHNTIGILIADDHPVIREGLATILELETDMKVVGQARDGDEACTLYQQLSRDILILDLRMPKKDGIEVVTELMSQRPDFDLHPQNVAEAVRANDRRVIEAATPIPFEESVPSAQGHRYYLSSKFLLRDRTGRPYAVCGIATDVSSSNELCRVISGCGLIW